VDIEQQVQNVVNPVLGPGFSDEDIKAILNGADSVENQNLLADGPPRDAQRSNITPELGRGYTDEELELALGRTIPIPADMDGELGPSFTGLQVDQADFSIELGKIVLGLSRQHDTVVQEVLPEEPAESVKSPGGDSETWQLDKKMLSAWEVVVPSVHIRAGPHRLEERIGMLLKGEKVLATERGGNVMEDDEGQQVGSWIKHLFGWTCVADTILIPRLKAWRDSVIKVQNKILQCSQMILGYVKAQKRAKRRSLVVNSTQIDDLQAMTQLQKAGLLFGDVKTAPSSPQKTALSSALQSSRQNLEKAQHKKVLKGLLNDAHGLRKIDIESLTDLVRDAVESHSSFGDLQNVVEELKRRKAKYAKKKEVLEYSIRTFEAKKAPTYLQRTEIEETPIIRMRYVLRYLAGPNEKFFAHRHLFGEGRLMSFAPETVVRETSAGSVDIDDFGSPTSADSYASPQELGSPFVSPREKYRGQWNQKEAQDRLKIVEHDSLGALYNHLRMKCRKDLEDMRKSWGSPNNFAKFASLVAKARGTKASTAERMSAIPLTKGEQEEVLIQVILEHAKWFYRIIYHTFDHLFWQCRLTGGIHRSLVRKEQGRTWEERQLNEKIKNAVQNLIYHPEGSAEQMLEYQHPAHRNDHYFLLVVRAQEVHAGVFSEDDRDGGPILRVNKGEKVLAVSKPFPPLHSEHAEVNSPTAVDRMNDHNFFLPKRPPALNKKDSAFKSSYKLKQPEPLNEVFQEYQYVMRLMVPLDPQDDGRRRVSDVKEEKKHHRTGTSKSSKKSKSKISRKKSKTTKKDAPEVKLRITIESDEGLVFGSGEIKLSVFRSKHLLCASNFVLKGNGVDTVILHFTNSGPLDITEWRKKRDVLRADLKRIYPNRKLRQASTIDKWGKAHAEPEDLFLTQRSSNRVTVLLGKSQYTMQMESDMETSLLFFLERKNRLPHESPEILLEFSTKWRKMLRFTKTGFIVAYHADHFKFTSDKFRGLHDLEVRFEGLKNKINALREQWRTWIENAIARIADAEELPVA